MNFFLGQLRASKSSAFGVVPWIVVNRDDTVLAPASLLIPTARAVAAD